jgi:hypothetical protein
MIAILKCGVVPMIAILKCGVVPMIAILKCGVGAYDCNIEVLKGKEFARPNLTNSTIKRVFSVLSRKDLSR